MRHRQTRKRPSEKPHEGFISLQVCFQTAFCLLFLMIQTAASALVPNVLPAAVAAEAADGGTKSR